MNDNAAITEITTEQKSRAAAALDNMALARLIGMRLVDLQPGIARVGLDMRDDLRQPSGVLHGGITATLIDTAMAFAMLSLIGEGEKTATIDLTVHYLRPHMDGAVDCTARVVRAGRRIFTISAEVFSADGRLIATAISTYTRL